MRLWSVPRFKPSSNRWWRKTANALGNTFERSPGSAVEILGTCSQPGMRSFKNSRVAVPSWAVGFRSLRIHEIELKPR